MSYDIYFVRRDPGQSFADALDATEDAYDGDPGPLGNAEIEQWERIAARARHILDNVEEFADDTSRDLADGTTGIQLSMIAEEVAITVPTARPEQDTASLMAKIYVLARIVEDETGLEGYDPQRQEPISDPNLRQSAEPDQAHSHADEDDHWGRAAPAGSSTQSRNGSAVATRSRRWWGSRKR